MIILKNISLDYTISAYEKIEALANINAEFPTGKISVLLGASGCGKTSLLHIIADLQKASAGKIFTDTKPLGENRKSLSIIFQDFGLLPWKTVYANAELPLKIKNSAAEQQGLLVLLRKLISGQIPFRTPQNLASESLQKVLDPRQRINRIKKNKRKEILIPLLKEFGLEKYVNFYPHQLSGGMKQRLAIIRSLITQPELLLMDEAFSSLDALTREDAQDFLLQTNSQQNRSIIIVTHSIDEAVYLADKIFIMTGKNPGTISHCVEIPERNKHNFRNDPRFQEYCAVIRNILKNSISLKGKNED
jgi:NitT/TauT family transport system ATP-binding protein